MAVISLLLSAVAICPKTAWFSWTQALTRWNSGLATGSIDTASDCLAVNGDKLAFGGARKVCDPGLEALLESLRVQGGKDPAKGIV